MNHFPGIESAARGALTAGCLCLVRWLGEAEGQIGSFQLQHSYCHTGSSSIWRK